LPSCTGIPDRTQHFLYLAGNLHIHIRIMMELQFSDGLDRLLQIAALHRDRVGA